MSSLIFGVSDMDDMLHARHQSSVIFVACCCELPFNAVWLVWVTCAPGFRHALPVYALTSVRNVFVLKSCRVLSRFNIQDDLVLFGRPFPADRFSSCPASVKISACPLWETNCHDLGLLHTFPARSSSSKFIIEAALQPSSSYAKTTQTSPGL